VKGNQTDRASLCHDLCSQTTPCCCTWVGGGLEPHQNQKLLCIQRATSQVSHLAAPPLREPRRSPRARKQEEQSLSPHHHPLFRQRERLSEAPADPGRGGGAGQLPPVASPLPGSRPLPPLRGPAACSCPLTSFIPATAERGARCPGCNSCPPAQKQRGTFEERRQMGAVESNQQPLAAHFFQGQRLLDQTNLPGSSSGGKLGFSAHVKSKALKYPQAQVPSCERLERSKAESPSLHRPSWYGWALWPWEHRPEGPTADQTRAEQTAAPHPKRQQEPCKERCRNQIYIHSGFFLASASAFDAVWLHGHLPPTRCQRRILQQSPPAAPRSPRCGRRPTSRGHAAQLSSHEINSRKNTDLATGVCSRQVASIPTSTQKRYFGLGLVFVLVFSKTNCCFAFYSR